MSTKWQCPSGHEQTMHAYCVNDDHGGCVRYETVFLTPDDAAKLVTA